MPTPFPGIEPSITRWLASICRDWRHPQEILSCRAGRGPVWQENMESKKKVTKVEIEGHGLGEDKTRDSGHPPAIQTLIHSGFQHLANGAGHFLK